MAASNYLQRRGELEHYFDRTANAMRPLARGTRGEVPMAFLILRDGKVIFDGDVHELAQSKDDYIREYIS